jgi:GT2 family glycosyltransferase
MAGCCSRHDVARRWRFATVPFVTFPFTPFPGPFVCGATRRGFSRTHMDVLRPEMRQPTMPQKPSRPTISVLIPAYNAERYVLQSVQSVLAQTYEDFELIVVNDASTDRTLEILSSIRDHRLLVLDNPRNLGIVGSLNRAMSEASGRYIARLDADDLCMPTRFARQVAFLDRNPRTMVVCTEQSVLERGQVRFSRQQADPDPKVLQWMLHVSNPIGHPSTMFRAEVVTELGAYLREEFKYAEDFDFLHRVLRLGEIAALPDYLTIYRQHDQNLTRTRRDEVTRRTTAVLRDVYSALLGSDRTAEATLVAEHLMSGIPFADPTALGRLGGFLSQLVTAFTETYRLSEEQRRKVGLYTGKLWWRTVQTSLRDGQFGVSWRQHASYLYSGETRPSMYQMVRSLVAGLVPDMPKRKSAGPKPATPTANCRLEINGTYLEAVPVPVDDPPSLFVVVDTEAEFDWRENFDRSLTSVNSMRQQFRAQDIFDGYGARPIYVVDYAVASQAEGYGPLREIFDRHGCAIGAHLHPWVNPPFEEALSEHNSYGGNLPAGLEERKLRALVAMIQQSFDISPLFFKAGRYGVGRRTIETLARLGIEVDFSILPLADLRGRGGPDFRFAKAKPYRVGPTRILSVPMTRGQFGLVAPLPPGLHGALRSPMATRFHLPGILSRTHLANTVTLTPEGASAQEQIQLLKSMVGRGYRTFTLHYHSPSLAKHTPYVTSEAELKAFLVNLETVCRFFFQTLGGMPGNPADLVPTALRGKIWPQPVMVASS